MKAITLAASVICLAAIAVMAGSAPQQTPRATPQVFDVASIKSNETGSDSRRATTTPGGVFTATNVSLKLLISRAYGVAEAQTQGGPGWMDTEKFDVLAKADTPLEMTREEVRPCLQALLAERFRLKVQRQTKQGSVYSLEVVKSGPKLKESSSAGSPGVSASSGSGKVSITGMRTTMTRLAEYLSGQLDRPTLDRTGLKGQYDFTVEWATDQAASGSGPSLFSALREQLGLRVDAVKGPIEIVIVDRAEKPSAN